MGILVFLGPRESAGMKRRLSGMMAKGIFALLLLGYFFHEIHLNFLYF